MKNFIKRTWRYFIFVPIFVVIVVGILLSLPNDNESLELIAENIELNVGEKVEVKYEVSNPNAFCSFKIDNNQIAILENEYVFGLSEGETKLTISAEYGNIFISKSVQVIVNANDGNNDNGQDIDEEFKITFKFMMEEVDEISVDVNVPTIIEIVSNKDFEIIMPNEIKIEEIFSVVNSYKLTALEYGEFEILFKIGESLRTLKVISN